MKRILRSIIDFHTTSATVEALSVNFQRVRASNLKFIQLDDRRIFQFISDYTFGNLGEIPSIETVRDYFERDNDGEALERLKDIAAENPYTRSNFAHLLKELIEDQNRIEVVGLLKEVQTIVDTGLTIEDGKKRRRLRGIQDGVRHFNDKIYDLTPTEYNTQTEGDIRGDGDQVLAEYQTAKLNKDKVYGKFLGIPHIDNVCKGLRRGELWIHAGFPGELKTSLAINWAYNLITRYRTNVFYGSFEMPYQQIRRMLYALHSSNLRFKDVHAPLDYRKLRDGELSSDEEKFFRMVVEDFSTNKEYCRFELWCPDRKISVDDVKMKIETHHRQWDVGFVVLDHMGDMTSREWDRDHLVRVNSIVRDAKMMALHFNGGEGVPVLGLFQLNRQGKNEAEKNEGQYKMSALSYANQAEKSADTITTTFLNDDLRERGRTVCCCLKNRDNPLFNKFEMGVDFTCRRLYQTELSDQVADGIALSDDDDMALGMV